MGVLAPTGHDPESFAEALFAGRSGAGPITLFDPAALTTKIAAEVKLSTRDLIEGDDGRSGSFVWALVDRKVAFAVHAARQAMRDATRVGTSPGHVEREVERACVSLGVGLELFSMDDLARSREAGFTPPTGDDAQTFLQTPSDVATSLISREFKLRAPPLVHVSACAAGADAIGAAYRMVSSGRRSWAIAGGTDSMINPLGVGGFCTLSATTTRNDDPLRASRPFDRRRDGFLLGEGAAMVVLEPFDDAIARGATIHAEIAGYGNSFDAFGISEPHPEARGALMAIERALADAGLSADDIDAINAHGTSTPKNDVVETIAYKKLLGDRVRSVPVHSTKSMIGHCISAAGAVEVVASILCMKRGAMHATLNVDEQDPACDLDLVIGGPRAVDIRHMLTNSFAFGGQNASLVLTSERAALARR
jgi:3-oxoacyl-[acyl-carrier-protein] synthase II